MTRWIPLALALAACSGGGKGSDGDDSGLDGDGACELAARSQTCPSCSDGPVTCTFGDTSVTRNSCGWCQAEAELWQTLCDQGEAAPAETIEADTTCEFTVECHVVYTGCPACTPTCLPTNMTLSTTCPGQTCPTPEDPPGECVAVGGGCAFQ